MSRKHTKGSAVIAGYYGFGNVGDELILQSLIQELRNRNPGAPITVFSAHPEETERQFNVHAVNRWHPWAWIGSLWSSELFLLGGGGLLQESTGTWSSTYYVVMLLLAKLMGCRTEVRAIGVDPIENLWNRVLTRFIFNTCVDSISVRDSDSQRALETAGVHRRLWRVPDLVFKFERPAGAPARKERPCIAWALSPWAARPGWDHDIAQLLDRVSAQLNVSTELLVFFPAQDLALAQKVSDLTTHRAVVRVGLHPQDLFDWIPEYGLVVGMRYHALALAARAEKPFIGWGFQRKVRTFCRDFSQPMWMFERGWDAEAQFRQICEAWRQRATLPDRYRTQMAQMISAPPVASESARIFVAQV